jgi:hypothetical protein
LKPEVHFTEEETKTERDSHKNEQFFLDKQEKREQEKRELDAAEICERSEFLSVKVPHRIGGEDKHLKDYL